jgi:RHS repeat-associated protein
LRLKDGTKFRFNCHGRLQRINDRHRNEIAFEYSDPTVPFGPTALLQTGGKLKHKLEYETINQVPRLVRVKSPDGYVYRYNYVGNELRSVDCPVFLDSRMVEARAVTQYGYAAGKLETITLPSRNQYLHVAYDGDRVFEQKIGGDSNNFGPLAKFNFAELRATDRRGVEITYELFDNAATNRLLVGARVIHTELDAPDPGEEGSKPPPHKRTFTFDANYQLKRMTDEDGRITAYEYLKDNAVATIGPERWDADSAVTYSNNLAAGNLVLEQRIGFDGEQVISEFAQEPQFNQLREQVAAHDGPPGSGRIITSMTFEKSGIEDGYAGNPTGIKHPKLISVALPVPPKAGVPAPPAAPIEASEKRTYNAYGQIALHTDTGSRREKFDYDENGYILTRTADEGALAIADTTKRDLRGHMISHIDANSHVTSYKRDLSGRLLEETDALNHTAMFEYDVDGHPIWEVRQLRDDFTDQEAKLVDSGHPVELKIYTKYQYDPQGNLSHKTIDWGRLGLTTHKLYDATENVIEERQPNAERIKSPDAKNHTLFEYEEHGHVCKIRRFGASADEETTEYYFYDGAGNRIGHREGAGNITRYRYDGLGRLEKVTLPNGSVISHGYDTRGNHLTEVMEGDPGPHFPDLKKPVRLHSQIKLHDEWNRVYCEKREIFDLEEPKKIEIREVRTVYDADGRVAQEIRPRSGGDHVTSFEYDGAHRVTKRSDNLGNSVEFKEYSGTGQVKKKIETEASTAAGRPAEVLESTMTYDVLDRLSTIRLQGSETYSRFYDSLGRLRLTVDPLGRRAEFQYDGAGRLVRSGEGYEEYTPQDSFGPAVAVRLNVTSTGALWTTREWDESSRLLSVTGPAGLSSYTYDAQNRLKEVWDGAVTTGQRVLHVTYDKAGRTFQLLDANKTTVRNHHDAMGQITLREIFPEGGTANDTRREEYRYDGASRLVLAVDEENGSYLAFTFDSADNYRQEIQGVPAVRSVSPLGALSYTLQHQVALSATRFDAQGFRRELAIRFAGTGTMQGAAAPLLQSSPNSFRPGRTFTYGRDGLGRVNYLSCGSSDGSVLQLEHTYVGPESRLHGRKVLGAMETVHNYDSHHRVAGLIHKPIGSDHAYGYTQGLVSDAIGNLSSRTQDDHRLSSESATAARHSEDTFSYDNRYQLIAERRGDDGTGFRRGWSVNFYDRTGTKRYGLTSNHDPVLSNMDHYFGYVFGTGLTAFGAATLAVPFAAPLMVPVLQFLGSQTLKPDRYFRQEENVSAVEAQNGRITEKEVKTSRVDVAESLLSTLTRTSWVDLPAAQMKYDYDRAGNLISISQPIPDPILSKDPAARKMQKAKEFRYDHRGRLMGYTDLVRAKYNRTVRQSRAAYKYDLFNRLIQAEFGELGVRRYVWDREHLLEELERVGPDQTWRTVRRYVWSPANGHMVSYEFRTPKEAAGDKRFQSFVVACDPQGNALYLADSRGECVETYDMSTGGNKRIISRLRWNQDELETDSRFRLADNGQPVSEQLYQASPVGFPFGAGGHYLDPISGLSYMRNRWYSPELGRFISRDPLDLSGSRYAYASNNATSGSDPTGAFFVAVLLALSPIVEGAFMEWLNQPYGNTDWDEVGKAALTSAKRSVFTSGISLATGAAGGLLVNAALGEVLVNGAMLFASAVGMDTQPGIEWAFNAEAALSDLQTTEIGGAKYLGSGNVNRAAQKLRALRKRPHLLARAKDFLANVTAKRPIEAVRELGRKAASVVLYVNEGREATIEQFEISSNLVAKLKEIGTYFPPDGNLMRTVGDVDAVLRHIWREEWGLKGLPIDAGHRVDLRINQIQTNFEKRMGKMLIENAFGSNNGQREMARKIIRSLFVPQHSGLNRSLGQMTARIARSVGEGNVLRIIPPP